MKIILIVASVFFLANGCKTNNKVTSESSDSMETNEISAAGNNKNAKLMLNSSYDVMEDTIGKYYISKKDGDSTVFEYTLSEKGEEGLADAYYGETVIFEFTDDMLPLSLSNDQLDKVKLMSSKHCKCPDAGYYKVEKGNLSVSKKGEEYSIALTFNVEGVDQKLSTINSKLKK